MSCYENVPVLAWMCEGDDVWPAANCSCGGGTGQPVQPAQVQALQLQVAAT